MQCPDITIDFPFERGDLGAHYNERVSFWESPSTIQWFKSRGYTLYKRRYDHGDMSNSTVPSLPFSDNGENVYPYGVYDSKQVSQPFSAPLHAHDTEGKVAYAQDSQNRHVAIKLVRADTDEHRILEFLRQQPLEILQENCVIPVLEILPIHGFYFAVMPRWGSMIHLPQPRTMGEVLQMMHALLKGLDFLHRNNIVHGDIKESNCLIDDFGDFLAPENILRVRRRAEGSASYAIFDFDFSTKLPEEIDRRNYWIPNEPAWGSFNVTMDFAQGEYDYNPFIMDVGALGVMFSHHYQHLIPGLPILAPFLDKLTTHRLNERFTSSEALSFFEEFYPQLTEEELQKPTWKKSVEESAVYYKYDRWAAVPPEFAKKWAHYREPPLSWSTKFLRRICKYDFIANNVARIRRCFACISAFRHAIASYFFVGRKITL